MLPPNTFVYLETSAVNFMADKFSIGDAKATKIYHQLKGNRFYVSPVTIYEILMTNKEERKENLIQYLQHLCYNKILNSPSEFVVNYILSGCPKIENKYDFHSKLPLGKVWEDLCLNPKKTFIYDKEELKAKSKVFLTSIKYVSKKIESVNIITPNNKEQYEDNLWLDDILKNLKTIQFESLTEFERKTYKISVLLMLFILCAEMEMDNTYIQKFWRKIGIDDTMDRLNYLLLNYEVLIYRGPFPVMAKMALLQMAKGGKATRGIFWDVLHSIYLIYLDLFFSNDSHFKKLRDYNEHLLFKRIVPLDESNFYTAKKIDIIENHQSIFL